MKIIFVKFACNSYKLSEHFKRKILRSSGKVLF